MRGPGLGVGRRGADEVHGRVTRGGPRRHRADALRAGHRPGPRRVPPGLPPRPAARACHPAPAVAAPEAPAEPFEALAWAICEQLIEGTRAVEIEKELVRRHGRRSACGLLRDAPTAAALASRSPAELERCGLSPKRAIVMRKAATEVASGRADLSDPEPSWRRLRRINGVGAWTLEKLALEGQGRDDKLPAGRPGLHQARGKAGRARQAGNPARGPRVLRPLRALRGPGGHLRA